MKFNHNLEGLNDDDRLSFNHLDLTVPELRYAVDQAFLSGMIDVFVESLQNQGIAISIGSSSVTGQDHHIWLRQGVPCTVTRIGTPRTGKIRVKVSIEFTPDRTEVADVPNLIPAIQEQALAIV